jgi:hypothetical protein
MGPMGPIGPAGGTTTTGSITRQQCVGASAPGAANGWNCAGIEVWSVTDSTGAVQKFTAMGATGQILNLPACPSSTACLKPAAIGAPLLALSDDGPSVDIADARWGQGFGVMSILPAWNPDLYALTCGNSQGCYARPPELQ